MCKTSLWSDWWSKCLQTIVINLKFDQNYIEMDGMHEWVGKFCKILNSHVDGLVEDCGISIAKALELPQSHTRPSNWLLPLF